MGMQYHTQASSQYMQVATVRFPIIFFILYLSQVAFLSVVATVQQVHPSVLSLLANPLIYFPVQVVPEQHLLPLKPEPKN